LVAALVASQHSGSGSVGYEAAKKRLVDAEARLGRFQAEIASGADPAALVGARFFDDLRSRWS
jgi:hypothetical protein